MSASRLFTSNKELGIEEVAFLMQHSRLALRHVTHKALFIDNMSNGITGDAIPLFNPSTLKDKDVSSPEALIQFRSQIKQFIEKSIVCYDTGLFHYPADNTKAEEEVEGYAKNIIHELKSGEFNKIYFMIIEVPYALPRPAEEGYPLGKFGKFRTKPEHIKKALFLNELERNHLIKSKTSAELRERLVTIFYEKFCQFIISRRSSYEKDSMVNYNKR